MASARPELNVFLMIADVMVAVIDGAEGADQVYSRGRDGIVLRVSSTPGRGSGRAYRED